MNDTTHETLFDPTLPLRPQPTWVPFTGATDELIKQLTNQTLTDSPPVDDRDDATDARNQDIGTWLLESLSHDTHHNNTRQDLYGPRLTEALTILSAIRTEPLVTLTVQPTTSLSTLIDDHELALESAFNHLVQAAHQLGLTVTLNVTTNNDTIRFPLRSSGDPNGSRPDPDTNDTPSTPEQVAATVGAYERHLARAKKLPRLHETRAQIEANQAASHASPKT